MTGKPILCLDFDGTIHSYASGWLGADKFDLPTPGAIAFILAAREHFHVAIHSSRFNHTGGAVAAADWLEEHGLARDLITYRTGEWDWFKWEDAEIVLTAAKPPAFLTIDDRALTFTGEWPAPERLLAFEPWNKRRHAHLAYQPSLDELVAENIRIDTDNQDLVRSHNALLQQVAMLQAAVDREYAGMAPLLERWQPDQSIRAPGQDRYGVEYTVTERGLQTPRGFLKLEPGDWLLKGEADRWHYFDPALYGFAISLREEAPAAASR